MERVSALGALRVGLGVGLGAAFLAAGFFAETGGLATFPEVALWVGFGVALVAAFKAVLGTAFEAALALALGAGFRGAASLRVPPLGETGFTALVAFAAFVTFEFVALRGFGFAISIGAPPKFERAYVAAFQGGRKAN